MAGNIVDNGGFENWTATNLDSWSESVTSPSTLTEETTDVFAGSSCVKMTGGSSNEYVGMNQGLAPGMEVGQEYTLTFYAKGTGACSIATEGCWTTKVFYLTTEWKKYSYTAIATSTTITIKRNSLSNRTAYIDKMEVRATPAKYGVVRAQLTATLAGTTDFTITDFGTPRAALIFLSSAYTDNTPTNEVTSSIGFWDGTNQNCVWMGDRNNVSDSSAWRGYTTNSVARVQYTETGVIAEYSISNITDGVRLTLDVDATSVTRWCTVVLFGGKDVEAFAGAQSSPATVATGAEKVVAGFRPDVVFWTTCCDDVEASEEGTQSFGVSTRRGSSIQQRMVAFSSYSGQPTSVTGCIYNNNRCIGQHHADANGWNVNTTQFNSDGVSIEATASTSDDVVNYLALKLPEINVDLHTVTLPTSTGTNAKTGLGFEPELLVGCFCNAATANALYSGYGITYCMGTAEQESYLSLRSVDNETTTAATTMVNDYFLMLRDHDGTVESIATIDSFDSDGYTLNFTTAATARIGWILAFGNATKTKRLAQGAAGSYWLTVN